MHQTRRRNYKKAPPEDASEDSLDYDILTAWQDEQLAFFQELQISVKEEDCGPRVQNNSEGEDSLDFEIQEDWEDEQWLFFTQFEEIPIGRRFGYKSLKDTKDQFSKFYDQSELLNAGKPRMDRNKYLEFVDRLRKQYSGFEKLGRHQILTYFKRASTKGNSPCTVLPRVFKPKLVYTLKHEIKTKPYHLISDFLQSYSRSLPHEQAMLNHNPNWRATPKNRPAVTGNPAKLIRRRRKKASQQLEQFNDLSFEILDNLNDAFPVEVNESGQEEIPEYCDERPPNDHQISEEEKLMSEELSQRVKIPVTFKQVLADNVKVSVQEVVKYKIERENPISPVPMKQYFKTIRLQKEISLMKDESKQESKNSRRRALLQAEWSYANILYSCRYPLIRLEWKACFPRKYYRFLKNHFISFSRMYPQLLLDRFNIHQYYKKKEFKNRHSKRSINDYCFDRMCHSVQRLREQIESDFDAQALRRYEEAIEQYRAMFSERKLTDLQKSIGQLFDYSRITAPTISRIEQLIREMK